MSTIDPLGPGLNVPGGVSITPLGQGGTGGTTPTTSISVTGRVIRLIVPPVSRVVVVPKQGGKSHQDFTIIDTERMDYVFDFGPWLGAQNGKDYIQSASVTLDGDATLTLVSTAIENQQFVRQWVLVSGAAVDTEYRLICSVVTAEGRQRQYELYLTVVAYDPDLPSFTVSPAENLDINIDLDQWFRYTSLGDALDSSTGSSVITPVADTGEVSIALSMGTKTHENNVIRQFASNGTLGTDYRLPFKITTPANRVKIANLILRVAA